MLYKVKGPNRYCGPSALSALFNISTKQSARLMREVTGKPAVRSYSTYNLTRVLTRNNVKWERIEYGPKKAPTFAQFALNCPPGRYILASSSHFFTYCTKTNTVCDNGHYCATKKPEDVEVFKKKRVRIRDAVLIISGTIEADAPEPKKTPIADVEELIFRHADKNLMDAITSVLERVEDGTYRDGNDEPITDPDNVADCLGYYRPDVKFKDRFTAYWYAVLDEAVEYDQLENNTSYRTINMLAYRHQFLTKT